MKKTFYFNYYKEMSLLNERILSTELYTKYLFRSTLKKNIILVDNYNEFFYSELSQDSADSSGSELFFHKKLLSHYLDSSLKMEISILGFEIEHKKTNNNLSILNILNNAFKRLKVNKIAAEINRGFLITCEKGEYICISDGLTGSISGLKAKSALEKKKLQSVISENNNYLYLKQYRASRQKYYSVKIPVEILHIKIEKLKEKSNFSFCNFKHHAYMRELEKISFSIIYTSN